MSERDRSPRRAMCAAVLSLESIVVALTAPVAIAVSDVAPITALSVGLGLALACVLAAGMLRTQRGYDLGWVVQVAAIGLGVLVTSMFFLGALFALLWGTADFLGRKIERERAEAFAAFDAQQAQQAQQTQQSGQQPGERPSA